VGFGVRNGVIAGQTQAIDDPSLLRLRRHFGGEYSSRGEQDEDGADDHGSS
jgi:hypothetical protein